MNQSLRRWTAGWPMRGDYSLQVDPPDREHLAWALLESGTYLEAWTAAGEHAALRAAYVEAAKRADHRVFALFEAGRPCGMSQATRRADDTWVLHQMSLDCRHRANARPGSTCSYWLMRAVFDYVATRAPARFQIWAEAQRSLSQAAYVDFHTLGWPQTVSDLQALTIYRATPALASAAGPGAVTEITFHPTPEERRRVLDACTPYLGPLGQPFAHLDRWIRVARIGERPVAAVVTDEGPQVNVFGVMNTCYVVLLEPLPTTRREALVTALLAAAHDRFRARRVVAALFAHPNRELHAAANGAGFRYVSTGLRWTASTALLDDYMRYLADVMDAS